MGRRGKISRVAPTDFPLPLMHFNLQLMGAIFILSCSKKMQLHYYMPLTSVTLTMNNTLMGAPAELIKTGICMKRFAAGVGNDGLPTTPGCWSSKNKSDNCNEAAIKFKFDLDGPLAALHHHLLKAVFRYL